MKYLLIFLLGLQIGMWCNGPKAYERGLKAGKWTRSLFGLAPIDEDQSRRGTDE